jgi:site-specific DNA recombinase
MIAEYERAQIRERTPARQAAPRSQRLAGGDVGYPLRLTGTSRRPSITEGFWEIDEVEAGVVREVFRRYTAGRTSIADRPRWLSASGRPTRTGKVVWDRSTVWVMLRNPAYRGQAAFGNTRMTARHGKPTRTTRCRGDRHGRRPARYASRPGCGR